MLLSNLNIRILKNKKGCDYIMSDTLIAVAVGGIIGIVPTIITSFIEAWKIHTQRKHELKLKYFELYKTKKIDALLDFSFNLGFLSADTLDNESVLRKYFAAAEKAACFLPAKDRNLIYEANSLAKHWKENEFDFSKFSSIQNNLSDIIYRELQSDFITPN